MTGVQTCALPICGFSEPAKVSEMLMKGLNGFIPKPYKQDKLLQQVEAVLSRRRRTSGEDAD